MAATLVRAAGSARLAARPGVAPRSAARLAPARRPAPLRASKGDFTPKIDIDTEEISKKMTDAATNTGAFLQAKWEETEDKPAAVAVTGGAILLLVALSSVVDAVDRIPIISDLVELVGVVVTGWFTYRYLVFGPDREELVASAKAFVKKVYGK